MNPAERGGSWMGFGLRDGDAMKEHPILFSAPMVRAILEGRKTQTRRVLKPQPTEDHGTQFSVGEFYTIFVARNGDEMPGEEVFGVTNYDGDYAAPLIAPGDRLWVRETWRYAREPHCRCPQASMADPCDRWKAGEGCESVKGKVLYRADGEIATGRWRPSIHMPRWASRITLEVTGVKVERLQDISAADVIAEGVCTRDGYPIREVVAGPHEPFAVLWEIINGPGAWEQNPWVAAYTFKVLDTKGVGQ